MSDTPDRSTRVTLLARLRQSPGDEASWAEFVDHYGPVIYAWCRRWQLQEADARDVTQEVLLRLCAALPEFTYDPSGSFRGWLKTVAHHAWQDFVRRDRPGGRGSGGSDVQGLLESVEARDDLTARLEAAHDREVLQAAVERVRARVAPQTWEAYRLTAVEGMRAAEAAERIPMRVAQVYIAKQRVLELLREEVQRLEGEPAAG